MICPKCGHENDEGEIFCQECDWQLNRPYKPDNTFNKLVIISFAGLVFGIGAVIVSLLNMGIYGAVFGGIGLVLSSFGQTYVRAGKYEGEAKKVFLIITTVALIASICGFVMGILKI